MQTKPTTHLSVKQMRCLHCDLLKCKQTYTNTHTHTHVHARKQTDARRHALFSIQRDRSICQMRTLVFCQMLAQIMEKKKNNSQKCHERDTHWCKIIRIQNNCKYLLILFDGYKFSMFNLLPTFYSQYLSKIILIHCLVS